MDPIVNNNAPNSPSDAVNPNGGGEVNQASFPVQLPPGLTVQAVLDYTKTRNKAFEAWFKKQSDHMTDMWKIFENINTGAVKSSKVVPVPVGNGIIETINSRLIPALFNRPKVVDAIQEFMPTDGDETKLNIDAFVNQKVLFAAKAGDKGKSMVKAAIIESVMMWRHLWKREVINTSVPIYQPDPAFIPDPMNPEIQPKQLYMGDQPQTFTKEYWDIEAKSPNTVRWEPTCTTCVQDSPWQSDTQKMSITDFMKWEAEGRIQGVDEIKKITPAGVSNKEDWETQRKRALGEQGLNFVYADDKEYKTEEWFACLTWENEGQTQYGEFHFFVVEGSVVILFEENQLPNKMKPIGSCPFYIKPRSVTGLSACDSIKGMQEQANTFAGKQNDLVERVSDPITYYDDTSGIAGRAAFMKNRGYQPVLDVKGILQPPVDATPIKINQDYIEFCINLCREISGANDQVQGIADNALTLGQFQGLVQDAGTRFADVVDTMNNMFLEDLAQGCFLFYQKFGVDGQMIVRDQGPEGSPISLTRQNLIGDYTFVATSSQSQANKQKAVADDQQFVQTMASIPPQSMGGQMYNIPKHIMEISLPLRDQKNGKDMFIPAPMPMLGQPGQPQPGQPMGQPQPRPAGVQ